MCDYVKGEPKITEPEKCVAQHWVDLDNLPQPLFLPTENILKSEFINIVKQQLALSCK
jgi:8-oxo-dGTP diphosphatase